MMALIRFSGSDAAGRRGEKTGQATNRRIDRFCQIVPDIPPDQLGRHGTKENGISVKCLKLFPHPSVRSNSLRNHTPRAPLPFARDGHFYVPPLDLMGQY
ncbi:hypothetical protein [Breoghania sp.]|uniref:hypothetical protein n=1 Tax=Breoghania sp. TaxID=2065378 RepID=UPI0029C9E920|nr:hypothetical protein [Breoghania sp.]